MIQKNSCPTYELKVGNVYPVRGGRSASLGYMQIILAITESEKCSCGMALMLIVDREGKPKNCDAYSARYFEDKMPIGFCDGLEDIDLTIRSL